MKSLEAMLAAIERAQAVIEFELDGTIIRANENFLNTLGYRAEDVVGRKHRMFVDPAEAETAAYAQFWTDLRAGTFASGKFRRIGRGGTEVWIQATYNPIFDETGRPCRVVKFATDITAAEQKARKIEADRTRAEETQQAIVSSFANALSTLARNDLVSRITDDYPAEYQRIKLDFNAALDQLQQALQDVAGTARNILSSTSQISSAADDLSRRTEQQAAGLEETAAALNEITTTVRKTSEAAKVAQSAVTSARTEAESSTTVVRNAIDAVTAIERSSSEIAKIIVVIDEIAFQTNLLALNAGVEAARAGDAGRGFAVVASEVRALAQRSAEAAREIKTLIQSSAAQVDTGVDLVGRTGDALNRIAVKVSEINSVVIEIATAANEQAVALAEINTAVNQMDQVTQQNAAMVGETTAASHSLAKEAENLSSLIDRFTLADSGDGRGRALARAHGRPDRPGTRRGLQSFGDAEATHRLAS